MGGVLLSVNGMVAVAVMMTAAPLSMRVNGGPDVVLDAVLLVASSVQFVGWAVAAVVPEGPSYARARATVALSVCNTAGASCVTLFAATVT